MVSIEWNLFLPNLATSVGFVVPLAPMHYSCLVNGAKERVAPGPDKSIIRPGLFLEAT